MKYIRKENDNAFNKSKFMLKSPLLLLNNYNKSLLYRSKYKFLTYILSNTTQSIDIDLKLFDTDNINFDIDMKFDCGSFKDEIHNEALNTVLNANDESGSPYPGLLIRCTGGSESGYKMTCYVSAKEPYNTMDGNTAPINDNKYQESISMNEIYGFPYHYINHFEFSQNQRHTFPTTLFSSLNSSLQPQRGSITWLYHCYIKQNGQYVRYLVPAQNKEGINGLYDFISERFFTTTCGDNFEVGPEI
jgi:hypothetical protein